MAAARIFDHEAALAQVRTGDTYEAVAKRFGVTRQAISYICRNEPRRSRAEASRRRGNLGMLAALGLDGRDPVRASVAAAASDRLHALRAQARVGGAFLCGPLQIAAAHAAGLTLDDIHEVFAVPPVEAVRAIAAHSGV